MTFEINSILKTLNMYFHKGTSITLLYTCAWHTIEHTCIFYRQLIHIYLSMIQFFPYRIVVL